MFASFLEIFCGPNELFSCFYRHVVASGTVEGSKMIAACAQLLNLGTGHDASSDSASRSYPHQIHMATKSGQFQIHDTRSAVLVK